MRCSAGRPAATPATAAGTGDVLRPDCQAAARCSYHRPNGLTVSPAATSASYYAFIQFAGFTMGKAVSQFSAPWTNYPGNNFDGLVGGGGAVTGVNQFTYTAAVRQRRVGLDQRPGSDHLLPGWCLELRCVRFERRDQRNWHQRLRRHGYPGYCRQHPGHAGLGMAQLSAAAHDNNVAYYCNSNINAAAIASGGSAVRGRATRSTTFRRDIPTTNGDLLFRCAHAQQHPDRSWRHDQRQRRLHQWRDPLQHSGPGISNRGLVELSGGTSVFAGGTTLGKVGYGVAPDAVFNARNAITGGQLQLISTWGMRGAINHNWDPYWNTSVYGAVAFVDYGGGARDVFCGNLLGGRQLIHRDRIWSSGLQPELQHCAARYRYPLDAGQGPDLLG